MHIWLNRFPPAHCEGFEDLIQDPYKLNDEVRGRQEEYELLLERGTPLHCRSPEQCGHCYLQPLCDTLDGVRATAAGAFEVIRVDTGWRRRCRRSRRRSRDAAAAAMAAAADVEVAIDPPARTAAGARPVAAPSRGSAARARDHAAPVSSDRRARPRGRAPPPRRSTACPTSRSSGQLRRLAAARRRRVDAAAGARARGRRRPGRGPGRDRRGVRVVVPLRRARAPWLRGLAADPHAWSRASPTRPGQRRRRPVPICAGSSPTSPPTSRSRTCLQVLLGRAPRRPVPRRHCDVRPDGRLEIFRYTRRYIAEHFYARSLRCDGCREVARCPGQHVNFIRAHGFAVMQPL
jgi:hypothetical protein